MADVIAPAVIKMSLDEYPKGTLVIQVFVGLSKFVIGTVTVLSAIILPSGIGAVNTAGVA